MEELSRVTPAEAEPTCAGAASSALPRSGPRVWKGSALASWRPQLGPRLTPHAARRPAPRMARDGSAPTPRPGVLTRGPLTPQGPAGRAHRTWRPGLRTPPPHDAPCFRGPGQESASGVPRNPGQVSWGVSLSGSFLWSFIVRLEPRVREEGHITQGTCCPRGSRGRRDPLAEGALSSFSPPLSTPYVLDRSHCAQPTCGRRAASGHLLGAPAGITQKSASVPSPYSRLHPSLYRRDSYALTLHIEL